MKNPFDFKAKTTLLGKIRKQRDKYFEMRIESIQQSQNNEESPLRIKTKIKMKLYYDWVYVIKELSGKRKKKKSGKQLVYLKYAKQSKILPRLWQIHREWESKHNK